MTEGMSLFPTSNEEPKMDMPPFVWAETEQPPSRQIFDDDPAAIAEPETP